MAEGFARKWGAGALEARSAGSRPSGGVDARAVSVMKERGVDIAAQASKGLGDLEGGSWDYVIMMGCGDACPIVPAKAKRDWAIPDPKPLPLDGLREVRDAIEKKVRTLVDEIRQAS
jgi:protein-tyrosine-phosphatase